MVHGVQHTHTKLIPLVHNGMVPMKAEVTTLNGINQCYLEEYGYALMMPCWAEPFHRQHLIKLFNLQSAVGTALGAYVISTALFWVSLFALLATLAQSGCCKLEVAVLTMGSWHKHMHITRANL